MPSGKQLQMLWWNFLPLRSGSKILLRTIRNLQMHCGEYDEFECLNLVVNVVVTKFKSLKII